MEQPRRGEEQYVQQVETPALLDAGWNSQSTACHNPAVHVEMPASLDAGWNGYAQFAGDIAITSKRWYHLMLVGTQRSVAALATASLVETLASLDAGWNVVFSRNARSIRAGRNAGIA